MARRRLTTRANAPVQAWLSALTLVKPPSQPPPPPPPAAAPAPDRMQQLKELGELKAQGVLTDAEFEAEKAKILAG